MMDIDFGESLIKLFIALPVVIVIAYSSLKLANKYMKGMGKSRNLEVVETVQVFNKAALSIVRIMDGYFVLGVSENGVETIRELTREESETLKAGKNTMDDSFAAQWGGFSGKWKVKGRDE